MQISIAQPCHENWNHMRPEREGRHCLQCSKTVVDFTAMQDAEVLNYFSKHSNICGRFKSSQLNRNLSYNHTVSRHTGVYAAAACAILLLPLNSDAAFQDQKTDSIQKAENLQIQMNTIKPRAFHFVFDTQDSLCGQILSVRFRFDDFQLDTVPDPSGSVHFQVPDSIHWQQIDICIRVKNGDSSFLKIPISELFNTSFGSAAIRVFSSQKVLVYSIGPPVWNIEPYPHIKPQIIMGIPPPYYRPWPGIDSVYTVNMGWTSSNIVLTGDTVLSGPEDDSGSSVVNTKPPVAVNHSRKGGRIPWDQFAFVLSLLALLASVFIWVRKDRKAKAPGQNRDT